MQLQRRSTADICNCAPVARCLAAQCNAALAPVASGKPFFAVLAVAPITHLFAPDPRGRLFTNTFGSISDLGALALDPR